MLDFIVDNYYVILIVGILLIFAIIGYIIDSLKTRKFLEKEPTDTYVPEEEIFIQKFDIEQSKEQEQKENIDELLNNYNLDKNKEDSN